MISILLAFIGTFSTVFPKLSARLAWIYFCTPVNKSSVNYQLFPPNFSTHSHDIDGEKVVSYHWVPEFYHTTCCVVHGWGGYTGSMRRLIEACLKHKIAVVSVDVTAHGSSSGKRANLASYRSCLNGIWNHYEQIESFVGHSIGGSAVALICSDLSKHPNAHRIKSKVLMSAPNHIETMADRFLKKVNCDKSARNYFFNYIEKVAGYPIGQLKTEKFLNASHQSSTLIIHDRYDEVIPFKDAEQIVKANPDSHLEVTENIAHNRIYRDKEIIQKTVEFILKSTGV